jgi:hypothetical protein
MLSESANDRADGWGERTIQIILDIRSPSRWAARTKRAYIVEYPCKKKSVYSSTAQNETMRFQQPDDSVLLHSLKSLTNRLRRAQPFI